MTPWMKPTSSQRATREGLSLHDGFQQGQIGIFGRGQVGKVTADGVIGQSLQFVGFAPRCRILERAHADVAGCRAGENRPLQRGFTKDRLPRGDHCQAAGGGDAQGVQGFADDVFPQHGPQSRPPVALPRKRRSDRTL